MLLKAIKRLVDHGLTDGLQEKLLLFLENDRITAQAYETLVSQMALQVQEEQTQEDEL